MGIESNVAIMQEAYRRWHDTKAGSVDYWLSLMTETVRFRSLAGGAIEMQFTRDSSNKEEVRHYFA